MTRSEFVAETAAALLVKSTKIDEYGPLPNPVALKDAVAKASELADQLERASCAPWITDLLNRPLVIGTKKHTDALRSIVESSDDERAKKIAAEALKA